MDEERDQLLKCIEAVEVERHRKSFHEAGHVVILRNLGFRIKSVTIDSENCEGSSAEGQVKPHHYSTRFLSGSFMLARKYHEKANDFAVCLLAGIVAESRHTGVPTHELWEYQGKQDYDGATRIALRLGQHLGKKLVEWEARAAELLAEPSNWAAVKHLASALATSEWLDEKDVQSCLHQVCKSAPRS